MSTLAGSTFGRVDATGTAAKFNYPSGVAVNAAGKVFVTDYQDSVIRAITPGGVVSTFAGGCVLVSGILRCGGFTNAVGTAARFNGPWGIAVDADGTLYIGDSGNNCIRKITAARVVTTLAGGALLSGPSNARTSDGYADGAGATAQFNAPHGVAVNAGGTVYVADNYNSRIRAITPAGVVSTLAGASTYDYADGTGAAAFFRGPLGVAVGATGTIYVADAVDNRIRVITPGGVVSTLAGDGLYAYADGTGTAAQFNYPNGLAVDAAGTVYVADRFNNCIRTITPGGVVSTLAGSGTQGFLDGTGASSQFYYPSGVALSATGGTVYVADRYNHRIRAIGLST